LLLVKPKIILADEPTNGLDEEGFSLCVHLFQHLIETNQSSLLVATHDKSLIQWCNQSLNLESFYAKQGSIKPKIRLLL
jgi:putative ABC transport system ATP-binding protein